MQTEIRVRLTPRSSKNDVFCVEGEPYRAKVTAPPLEGLANKALVALLSERLGLAKRDIEITSGKSSRLKTVRIRGLTEAEIAKALEPKSEEHRA